MKTSYDAAIIGSGPNGLAAAIILAQAGKSVALFEAEKTIGGGMRSAELTLPGFIHDICSAIHPLAIGSPFFRSLPSEKYQVEWVQPVYPLAHPFDDGSAAILDRSIDLTGKSLDDDAKAYAKLMKPFVENWKPLFDDILAPFHFPEHPILLSKFGLLGLRSAVSLSNSLFKGLRARGLFAGMAAHSILPLEKPLTSSFALVLGILGHAVGWPIAKGGSQNIANALADYLRSLGGDIFTGTPIDTIDSLGSSRTIICDLTPKQLLKIAGHRFPPGYKHRLENYRYGPGVFKIDWALRDPIPWKARECTQAGTIHIGGSLEEIAFSEREVWQKLHPQKPFIILAQQSLFDPTRAPQGKQTAWGYCHVPNSSTFNMTERIENQIERFAPGFKDCIQERSVKTAMDIERYNPNYVGGDINGGVQDLFQLFTRPVARLVPYSTPVKGLFLCSSSTPPGGGVHGMCGYNAALAALKAQT